MQLNTASLEKAIKRLKEALAYCASPLAQDEQLALHLRAAAIQAFEFTYELSLKMLKRYLSLTEPNPNIIDEFSFNEFIRKGYEKGLILSELEVWKEYRKNRGTTSHTYDEDKALEVFEQIPLFLQEAEYLLSELKKRKGLNT